MHDYQLERLNTRSFEQLIQSLGLEVIGKQVIIFGDGPDGGREATFEGPVKYPEGKKQWNGYGMMQAKFHQILDSSAKKNADWAIAQLKAEFKKLKPRPKGNKWGTQTERCCPDYYIFATNVSLSPVAKKGGKDRFKEVLNGFKKSHGLKDYAIWDGDQIRRFLDTYPGIRVTYAAWVLPGDVLSTVIKHLELNETGFTSTMNRFLASELLDDQYARLGQGGYTDANTIPLSKVFVDLPVDLPAERTRESDQASRTTNKTRSTDAHEKQRLTFLQSFLEEGRQILRPSANPHRLSEQLHSRRTAGRVVLIGGPGQGKTTVGQFACQLLRASLLRVATTSHSPEVVQAIEGIERQSKDLQKPQVLRYPLRVDLKKLAEAIAGKGDYAADSILDFLVKYISKRTDSSLRKEEFRKWLQGYPWLLVLDGLDEVPASSNRKQVMDAIRDFVGVEAHQQDADLLILATTRPQGYSDEFDRTYYCHLPLSPLNAVEALNYGSKLAQARHPGLKSRVEELSSSLKRATNNPATVRLMESPLQVTIMLALIEGGGEPPEQRWKLFHDYYDVIYRREKERGTPFSAILGRYEPDINWIHHRAGWILQQRNAIAGATAARLTNTEFEKIVTDRLLFRGHENQTIRSHLVSQICDAATDRLVFLVGNTADEIGFEIRSLQEFMTAEHCFDGFESCVQETIRAIAASPYWRNVFLFVAGRIFFEKENLIDSLIAVCERLNETLTDPAEGEIVAGSRLALAMLHDGAARNQPDNIRLLARCAAKLFDMLDGEEITTISSVFQGEAAEVWKEEITKRIYGVQTTFPGNVWRLCLRLSISNNEWALQTIKNRFPWSHKEAANAINFAVGSGITLSITLWEILRTQMMRIEPEIWMCALELPEPLKIEPLIHLKKIREYDSPDGAPVLDNFGNLTSNKLDARSTTFLHLWAGLKIPNLENAPLHSNWAVYHAISEFARVPTHENLAAQLRIILNASHSFPSWFETWHIPWQILITCEAKASGMMISDICKSVEIGKLGTAIDWNRWAVSAKAGVKLSALNFPDGPLSASDDHLGAVYSNAIWTSMADNSESNFKFIELVTASLVHLVPESLVAFQVIRLACFGIYARPSDWSKTGEQIITEFIGACRKLNFNVTREFIVAIINSTLSIDKKTELISIIGGKVMEKSWLHKWESLSARINSVCEEIIDGSNDPEKLMELALTLSLLPPLPFAKKIPPTILDLCRNKSALHRNAAVVFTCNKLEWRLEDAANLAAEAWNVHSQRDDYLGDLLNFIDSQGVHGRHLEFFLLALLEDEQGRRPMRLREEIATLLLKLIERRPPTHSLPDPSVKRPSTEESIV